MPASTHASLEIDQTLRLARDRVEREIARYRVAMFAVALVCTVVTHVLDRVPTWMPTVSFAGAIVYALVMLAYVTRVGNPPALASIALVLDLLVPVSTFVLARIFGPPDIDKNGAIFATNIVGPILVLTLLVNTLRNSIPRAVIGGGVAVLFYFPTVIALAGFHPAQLSVCAILILAGLIGAASAIQARKNLDNFARLQLLRRYLPPEAVLRVMREDPDSALAPGGRLVTVTLLAADLRGFTAMSEDVSPGEVMSQLNAYHGAMIDVIERHGGAIDKFIGDGTLVVFGLTGPVEAAAVSAVACAGAMLDALAIHNEDRARGGAPPLAMGIGVHTGPVIAGNLGIPGKRLEFTVIGDTVNTVSRLEGQTKTSGSPVIVSADTASFLPSTRTLRELPPVSLRGKAQAVTVFGLLRYPTLGPPSMPVR